MNWWSYIKDKRFFLLFFCSIMFFVGVLISIDPNSKLTLGNFIYLYVFVLVFLLSYLVLGYFFKYNYWREMKELVAERLKRISLNYYQNHVLANKPFLIN